VKVKKNVSNTFGFKKHTHAWVDQGEVVCLEEHQQECAFRTIVRLIHSFSTLEPRPQSGAKIFVFSTKPHRVPERFNPYITSTGGPKARTRRGG